ncbi:MAG: DUF2288 domain-containing protein [Verrucomicrobiota bacterium]
MSENKLSDEAMTYQMLGGDKTTTKDKLDKYTGEVDWSYLEPHFQNGALLYLDPSLSLTEVGEALTRDDAKQIQSWKQTGDLVTPSEPHAQHWKDSKSVFRALVVSPFVLIQPLPESDSTS